MKKAKEKNFKANGFLVFMSYFGPHWKSFAVDLGCAITVAAIDLIFPYVSRYSMQTLLPQGAFKTFFVVMSIMALAYILKGVLYYVINYVGHRMGIFVEADMRRDIFSHMQQLSFSYYDKHRTGALMSRVTTDLFDITELAHHGPENVIICVLTIGGSMAILFTIQWKLTLVLCLLLPLFFFVLAHQRMGMKNANMELKKRTAEINSSIESGISGIRTAKAFANEKEERKKFNTTNGGYIAARVNFFKAMGLFNGTMEFTMGAMQVVVVAVGGFLIMRGEMDYINLLTFSLYVSTFIAPIRKFSQFMEMYMQGSAGFSRFLQIMREEPAIKDKEDAEVMPKAKGDISYENVSFAYNGGENVLSGVNLEIPAGSCLAVVGPSGGGKTTLCHLLPRFYDVTGGAVKIDGVDIRDVTQESLRRNIGIIQQDVFMFAGTVKDNIRYGRPDATDEEIVEAAVRAEIHSEIMEMPNGYDTYIGERGVMLSGGQKQRISIARVFLKNPPILILDEATSALDSVTEQRIQESLDALSQGRTTIIIAHRLSTIRRADTIAVIEKENIAEMGSHEELMAKGGIYAGLQGASKRSDEE